MTQSAKKLAPYRETKRLKASERRRLILDAAQSILLCNGFAALTLRNTAEAAEIRLATLQYYFPTREQLFKSAFQDITDRAWAEVLEQLRETEGTKPELRLRSFLRSVCATTENEEVVGFFTELWAAARTHKFAAEIMQSYYDDAITLLARLIRETNPSCRLKKSKQRAVVIISMVEGLTLFHQMDSRANRKACVSHGNVLESMMAVVF